MMARAHAGDHQNPHAPRLVVPDLPADVDTLTAAFAYAANGWYLVPTRRGSKHPGSVVGDKWQDKSSRDPEQIAAWFAGTDYGTALHMGRSGAVGFDIDNGDATHPLLRDTITVTSAPFQTTRVDDHPLRGHHLFAVPPGRKIGNSKGKLPGPWGEVRCGNGVLIAAPSVHAKADEGGLYRWQRTGPLPLLPPELDAALSQQTDAVDAATDAEITAFMAAHLDDARPELLRIRAKALAKNIEAGDSRHDSTLWQALGAMKEARAGYYPAIAAHDELRDLFVHAATRARPTDPTARIITEREALTEYAGIVAWAVGQANTADLETVHQRVAGLTPTNPADLIGQRPARVGQLTGLVRTVLLGEGSPDPDDRVRRLRWAACTGAEAGIDQVKLAKALLTAAAAVGLPAEQAAQLITSSFNRAAR